jgi:eukaryotic-like serine/threonine-protein kinase
MDLNLDLTGRRVGRYEIRSLLGRGGMGAVYRAYDSNLDRHVAVKILPPHLVADADRVRRFVQEAKSASALNHPHVISVYEIGEDSGIHYIAMELVEGSTLRDRMGGAALEIKRAVTIGEEIAEAIGAAHEAGVVHRDLKPENVIIASSGYVKVLDFGLAKLVRQPSDLGGDAATEVKSTEPGRILGTVGYMAPEQAEGRAVDHRADIFSIGCILYEMVSGRAPFRGRSGVETLHNIAHVNPAPLSAPNELQRIIGKALAKEPEERYQSAKDLAVDLKRLLRELDSNSALTTEYGFAPARSRKRLWLALAAVAVAAIVAAIAFNWSDGLSARRDEGRAESPSLQLRRITSTGNVIAAAVSPDGKYVAYVNSEQGQQALLVRQLATDQDLQLVPPAEVGFWGHSFSPDGASIYYVLKTRASPNGTLYAISILGGSARRILEGIDSPVSFSPDGKQFTYVRGSLPPVESALVIANADGTNVRVAATRKRPQFFYPNFYTGPAWSPDGKHIAVSTLTREPGGNTANVVDVDVATGTERVVSAGWDAAHQVAWLPDGRSLLVVGARGRREPQVWRVPWPSGQPQPVTNDLLEYRMPSVTADGTTIVAVAADRDGDLWRIPLAPGETPRKLRGGKAAGVGGLAIAPDGSIVYSSLDGGSYDLWVTDENGASVRRLTSDPGSEIGPRITPDAKTVVFGSYGANATIRRIAFDGSESRPFEIATATGFEPAALSPDGTTVVFRTMEGLMKMPLEGGTATPITTLFTTRAVISPDGTRVACFCPVETLTLRGCIFSMKGGPPEQTVDLPPPNFSSAIRWTPDGKSLLVNTTADDRRNIWRIPLGGGKPERLTNFTDQLLIDFDLTPDGKAFIASRGDLIRDAVMITGFR